MKRVARVFKNLMHVIFMKRNRGIHKLIFGDLVANQAILRLVMNNTPII